MQWVEGSWDGLAQFFGYDYFSWGSAGEWIGGIGALAAVGVALFLYNQDRREKKFRHRDHIVFKKKITPARDGNDLHSVLVTLINAGGSPVIEATLYGPPDSVNISAIKLSYSTPGSMVGGRDEVIPPGARGSAFFGYERLPDPLPLLVTVRDISTNLWFWDVNAEKWIAAKEAFERFPMIADVPVNG